MSWASARGSLGSVNTLVRRADGSIYGDNTDMFGFESLLHVNGIDPAGMKALVARQWRSLRLGCAPCSIALARGLLS